jgi:hypothetical protein
MPAEWLAPQAAKAEFGMKKESVATIEAPATIATDNPALRTRDAALPRLRIVCIGLPRAIAPTRNS